MIFIPFTYFLLLTFYLWYKHRTFDVGVYMSSLYTFTSFCAIVIILGNMLEGSGILFDGWKADLGFIPTVLYCTLLTITIIPFSFIRTEKLTNITNNHPLLLFCFVLILLAQALLNVYLVADSTLDVLNGDLKAIRDSHYQEEMSLADLKTMSLPGPVQYFNYLNYSTILALPLFFYYSCIEKRSLWITGILLFISLSAPLKSIQAVDRAEIMLYGLMLLFCLVFFRNIFTPSIKRLIIWGGTPLLAIFSLYLSVVSSARFERSEEGTSGSVLQYAGQSYLNFCYFYDNANPDLIYPQREFPIVSHVVFKSDYGDVKEERSAKEGFFIGVFATHVGAWMLDIGIAGCIMFALLYALICVQLIKYVNRTEFDISEVLMIFVLATIPIFGIFYYRFHNFTIALQYLLAGILYILSKFKFVWKKD